MNKKIYSVFKTIFLILIISAVAFTVFAGVYAYTIMNDPDVITIGIGEKYTLNPSNTDFSVRSYNAQVISPSGGSSVTGNTLGEGVVCVKYSYFDRDFYRFKVVDAPADITLNKTELNLGEGETFTLSAQTNVDYNSFSVSYRSSDQNVATVTDNGVIKANGTGSCEIVASTYNKIESRCLVTVKSAPTSITLSESEVVLGKTEQLSLTASFENDEYSGSVAYISSDENVATITDGVITAKNVGECEITATAHNGTKATCKVIVKKLPEAIDLIIPTKHIVNTTFSVLYDIGDDTAVNNVDVSVSDDAVLKIDEEDKTLIHCLKKGSATVTVTLPNGVTSSKHVSVDNYTSNTIKFTTLNQYPYLPTGCEVVSLTSVLRHYGFDIDAVTMADKYMPKVSYDYFSVSPHDYFLGDPHTADGFGCFSGCLVKTAENYFKDENIDDYVALDITGCSFDELYSYLENDIPVVTWVTSGFVDPYNSGSWVVNGETINWCNHEHCLVTTGYDKNTGRISVADNSGGYNYTVSKTQYEKVFKGMGSMAVVVLKK